MRKILMAVLMSLGLLAGCEGEPSYKGFGFMVYNYTQFDIDRISLADKSGNSAVTMQVSVGAGDGSVACCFTLKGTEFTAKWRATDSEILRKHIYDDNVDQYFFTREKAVHFPAADIPSGSGPLYLQLHIYPDEHVELALSRKLIGNNRLPIVKTAEWLWDQNKDSLGNFRDGIELMRVIARVTKTSWGKYRIEDAADMRAYMKMYFTVASNFDQDPAIAAVLEKKDRQPGEFARVIDALSPERMAAIRESGSAPGDKNG
ncbi:hypothetical protein [Bordetella sp. LUAb4]|uniref:hypothetical protein n=1 Tax=Bordetella sp. LUAb4 TaxID=2843195 RepID=UPI001E36EC35|nr:hypothetical protein [Bordetella sp. LUAb4]